ncbi:hypothetical protein SDC9_102974 [bioreactor metagenome]|uniref:Uncharacterized protein n=1 Tax=bioreactor metagenome TaxID=1076179 RepID=A0A645ASC0_9ZZZZ
MAHRWDPNPLDRYSQTDTHDQYQPFLKAPSSRLLYDRRRERLPLVCSERLGPNRIESAWRDLGIDPAGILDR